MPPFRAAALLGILLVGAWSGLALLLGSIAPAPPAGWPSDDLDATNVPLDRRAWTVPVFAAGADPCTGEAVVVAARLAIETTHPGRYGMADTDVSLHLDDDPSDSTGAHVLPLERTYAPYQTPIRGRPYVHTLRTPLTGLHAALDLVIDVTGQVDDHGQASVWVSGAHVDTRRSPCDDAPAAPPRTHVTKRTMAPAIV